MLELESKIEGLLFYKGEEVQIKELAKLLNANEEEIGQALVKLEQNLVGRGITLVKKDESVILGVSGELGSLIESIRKEEINTELSKASLETLSIILYKNNIARSEIDYIRGVNSSFILRSLLVRGLVEKVVDRKDSRRVLYRPTFDTLSYLGVTSIEQLPNYSEIVTKLSESITKKEDNNE